VKKKKIIKNKTDIKNDVMTATAAAAAALRRGAMTAFRGNSYIYSFPCVCDRVYNIHI